MTIQDSFSCSALEWIMELCDAHTVLSKNTAANYGAIFDSLNEARSEFILLDDDAKLDVFTYLLGRATEPRLVVENVS